MDDRESEARLSRRLHARFDVGAASPALRQRVAVSLSQPARPTRPAWQGFAGLGLGAAIVIVAVLFGLRSASGPSVKASPSPSPTARATPISSPSSTPEPTTTPAPVPTLGGTVPPESTTAWTGLDVELLPGAPPGLGQIVRWSGGYVASVPGGALYASRDGRAWARLPGDTLGLATATPPGSTMIMTGAACGTGVILLTQDYAGVERMWFSADGVQWTSTPAPSTLGWVRTAATAAGRTFITSDSGLWHTVDCHTWQQVTLPGPADVSPTAVASFGDTIVVGGGVGPSGGGTADEPAAWWSSDGTAWRAASMPHLPGFAFKAIQAGSRGLVGQVYTGGIPGSFTYLNSSDGRSWETGFGDPLGLQPSGEGVGDPNGELQGDGNRLLLWGTRDPIGSSYASEAWISSDGRTWTRLALTGSGAAGATQLRTFDVGPSLLRDGVLFSGAADRGPFAIWFGTAKP